LKGDAMSKFVVLSASLVVMLVALLAVRPAQALDNITFVKSTGGGTLCTLAAPCGTFPDAQTATAEGGEIHCLDSGYVVGGNISKSITIDCAGSATVTGAFIVSGTGIIVTIRNLTFSGVYRYVAGIQFFNGAALLVENCVIANYTYSAGIRFGPSSPGSKLVVTDTMVRGSGSGSAGGGIVISPQSGGSAQVVLNRVSVDKNIFGIVADGSGSTAGINMTITDSVSSGNLNDGIIATTPAGGAPIGILVTNSKSANNGFGIRSLGAGVTVRVESSKVVGNSTGLAFSGGGALQSYGNNAVDANAVNGAFSGPIPLK
jgi:hypothetical protein